MREGGYKIIDFKGKTIEEVYRWGVIRDEIINSGGKSILISGLKYGGKILNDFCTTVEVNAQNYIFLTIIATSTKCVDLVIMDDSALYRYYYLDQIDKKIADGDSNTLAESKKYTDKAKADAKTDLNTFKIECYEHNNIVYLPDLTSDEISAIEEAESGSYVTVRSDAYSDAIWNCRDINTLLFVTIQDTIGTLGSNPLTVFLTPINDFMSTTPKGFTLSPLIARYSAQFTNQNTNKTYLFSVQIQGIRENHVLYNLRVKRTDN